MLQKYFNILLFYVVIIGKDGTGCGTVIAENFIDRGAEKRNFEGEEVSTILLQ